jgi:hypothetical protein
LRICALTTDILRDNGQVHTMGLSRSTNAKESVAAISGKLKRCGSPLWRSRCRIEPKHEAQEKWRGESPNRAAPRVAEPAGVTGKPPPQRHPYVAPAHYSRLDDRAIVEILFQRTAASRRPGGRDSKACGGSRRPTTSLR